MTISRKEGDELWEMAEEARNIASEARADIARHEAVCAERYKSIVADLTDIKAILKGAAIMVVTALTAVAWTYIKVSLHL